MGQNTSTLLEQFQNSSNINITLVDLALQRIQGRTPFQYYAHMQAVCKQNIASALNDIDPEQTQVVLSSDGDWLAFPNNIYISPLFPKMIHPNLIPLTYISRYAILTFTSLNHTLGNSFSVAQQRERRNIYNKLVLKFDINTVYNQVEKLLIKLLPLDVCLVNTNNVPSWHPLYKSDIRYAYFGDTDGPLHNKLKSNLSYYKYIYANKPVLFDSDSSTFVDYISSMIILEQIYLNIDTFADIIRYNDETYGI